MKDKDNFWKHPLLLMIMGFILTNIVGSRIVTSFNVNEFKTKQRFLYEEKILNHQIEVSEEFATSINDYQSKSMRISRLYWEHCNITNLDSLKLLLGDNMWNKNRDLIKYKCTIYYGSAYIESYIDSINSIILGANNQSSNYLFSQLLKKVPDEFLHDDPAFIRLIVQTRKNYTQINAFSGLILNMMSTQIKDYTTNHTSEKPYELKKRKHPTDEK